MTKILITGVNGLIGGVVRRALADRYELRGLGRTPVDGLDSVTADLVDLAAIKPAFVGIDCVVHLAAGLPSKGSAGQAMIDVNVTGTYNVFEAAREAGVKRVVFASSGAVISGWEKTEPYATLVSGKGEPRPAHVPMLTHETPIRPGGLYGATKAWGEAIGRTYADQHGISVLCVRIGHVTASDRPEALPRSRSIWCSHRDVAQLITRCLEAPATLAFDIFYGSSQNELGYRDLEHGRDVLGFVPEDSAERVG
ncbi:MAG: NAD(P)-dependent oxidoreductase [Kofleriaceae bacterium]